MQCEILVRGGEVVDPSQGLRGVRDVAIAEGRILAVSEQLEDVSATNTVDARGLLVVPGLIDLHVHVWWGVAHLGIEADPHCLRRGATTVYDAGSAGADTFPGFKKYVIDGSATRIKAFLHISSQGQLSRDIGELTDMRYADLDRAVEMCERYKEDIVGIKKNNSSKWVQNAKKFEATFPDFVAPTATGAPSVYCFKNSLEEYLAW